MARHQVPASELAFTPPRSVQEAARRGLRWREQFGRGGLTPAEAAEQGIGSGITRARGLASGAPVPLSQVRRIAAYFSRHQVDQHAPHFDDMTNPSNGRIAWELWGGYPAWDWVDGILDTLPADMGGRG